MTARRLEVILRSLTVCLTVLCGAVHSGEAPARQATAAGTAAQTLDFEFFKTRVEPIFLKKRPGLARCYVCHGVRVKIGYRRSGFRLQTLSPESTFWTEEQSRLNYEVVSRLVTPGETTKSRLLVAARYRVTAKNSSPGLKDSPWAVRARLRANRPASRCAWLSPGSIPSACLMPKS